MFHPLTGAGASFNRKLNLAGHQNYFIVGLFKLRQPDVLLHRTAKQGSTVSGLMDSFATPLFLAGQHRTRLKLLCESFTHTRFQPSACPTRRGFRLGEVKTGFGIARSPDLPTSRSPDFPITGCPDLPDVPVTRCSDFPITRSPDHPIPRSPDPSHCPPRPSPIDVHLLNFVTLVSLVSLASLASLACSRRFSG
ncbi:MAG TPA: hypothetical protein VFL42_14335 [Terriglobales bacterium]|nr:hypothetical protein [Terriglobales bacterium]